MSIKVGPKIVTSGLICDLDPGQIRSYTGTGNTWYNLISANYHQQMSSVGYTTDNKGLINFNTGGYSYASINSAINIEGPLSMTFWLKYSQTINIQSIGITNGTTSPTAAMQIGLRPGAISTVWKYGGAALLNFTNPTTNTWYHYGLTLSSSFLAVYINSILNNSGTVSTQSGAALSLIFGDYRTDGTGNERIYGYVGNFQLYNRALTAQEILQNYNATKGRYGL